MTGVRFMPSVAEAIVLCGGAGTRLRSVTGDAPKSLASIGSRPFLDILLSQLRRHGFQRIILAVGFQRDLIRSHFDGQALDISLEYSIELTPLGTGGGLRNAAELVESGSAVGMLGGQYPERDLSLFVSGHRQQKDDEAVVVVSA